MSLRERMMKELNKEIKIEVKQDNAFEKPFIAENTKKDDIPF
jgi:hypothetical protein